MSLEIEYAYFESKRQEFLKLYEGKHVLIVGGELLGVFDTPWDAYAKGIELRGNIPMLIKEVLGEELRSDIPLLTLGLLGVDPQ